MIEFKSVFIQYVSEFYSLYDFSCEIKSHTLFVGDFFDGTNSIVRILSKIDKDYKGEVFIDNIDLKKIKDKDLDLAYLPEKPVLFKNIFKNLYFPLKIRKINKKIAKNLIYCVFFELKNNNFNFFEKYLNIKNNKLNNNLNLKNKDFINLQIENILKLKVKNLTLSEQKFIALIRAVLRAPKYVLLENFFEDLDESHIPIVLHLIEELKQTSTIIACEKEPKEVLKDFKVVKLSHPN